MNKAYNKILSFADLKNGWYYGRGKAPSQSILIGASLFAGFCNTIGFLDTDAFPGIDGEIMVTGYLGYHSVEVTLELDGTFRFLHQFGEDEVKFEEGLSGSRASDLLVTAANRAKQDLWRSYDLFTQSTTIHSGANSRTSLFDQIKIPLESVEFPALNGIVQSTQADQFVHTLQNTTRKLPLAQPYFGSLTNPTFRQLAA